MLRLLTVAAPAAVAVLAAGSTAAAATVTLPLHSAHRGVLATEFASNDCAKDGSVPAAGVDRWVFVLPHNDADFVSLTLSFKTLAGTTKNVTIPDGSDPYPDAITTNGTSKAWVDLPSGWTLLDGSAVVSGPTKAEDFNLTHTCIGAPSSPSPSPSKTTSSPSPSVSVSVSTSVSTSESTSPSTSPSVSGGASGAASPSTSGTALTPAGDKLPLTGTAVSGLVLTGLAAIALGASLLWLRRRRDTPTFTAE
jgi:LPXTG-motif cell wall-anchored protein